jgi:tRNA A37 threonylcarbamoyladenosine biosynthesis protein TsaE
LSDPSDIRRFALRTVCCLVQLFRIGSGKQAIINAIRENAVTVLLGETGSGKTTREWCGYLGVSIVYISSGE